MNANIILVDIMKSISKTVKTITSTSNSHASAGADGISLPPPAYGIESVDRASAETVPVAEQQPIAGTPAQRKANLSAAGGNDGAGSASGRTHTGLPDTLKAGVESLSGLALDDVRVHYNSSKPATLDALAYAQGTDIHIAPGQERHLPHEAWHVVQQAQGRVKPTFQMKGGVNVNDDAGLEKEADDIGAKAMQFKALATEKTSPLSVPRIPTGLGLLQRQALVIVEDQDDTKVVISASGEAQDFSGGAKAANKGWNGVKKYKADAKVGDTKISSGMINNKFIVGQAGHILAQQNGGDGGDPENVFAQDGGVNNGPYRSNFENPMRSALDEADDDDQVHFRAVLYGDKIRQGPLAKLSDNLDGSDEETDFEGFSSD